MHHHLSVRTEKNIFLPQLNHGKVFLKNISTSLKLKSATLIGVARKLGRNGPPRSQFVVGGKFASAYEL